MVGNTTINRATTDMHQLGFPVIGLTRITNVNVTITTSEETVIDYRSPVAEYGVIWRRMLCEADDLESYEEAVSDDSDMDISE